MNKNYFESPNEIKWCPGCGNYLILNAVQKTLSSLNMLNENTVFISGIGCAGRFPYYMNAYGFHTLHGRSPAVATGLRLIRPDLNIWLVIGDGDGFSIGLGHTLHLIRRNINIKILFINNKIYSLTKGQYSPTSNKNFITKSSPYGSIENPINPILLALNVGGSFVARVIDNDIKSLKEIIKSAIEHTGTAFIEILQNCNIFNDGIYEKYSTKDQSNDNLLILNDQKPLTFGIDNKKNLIINNYKFEVIEKNLLNKDLVYHKINDENIIQTMLADISFTELPLPVGIFRSIKKQTYEDLYLHKAIHSKKFKTIEDLL